MVENKEKQFWDWFEKNQQRLVEFIDSEGKDYEVFHEMSKEIKKVNPLLFSELSLDRETNKYQLIVTPDGIRDGLKPTIKLTDEAPEFENWEIIRFRPVNEDFNLEIEGMHYNSDDFRVLRSFDMENEMVDIAVCIKGFVENDNMFVTIGFLALDHLIGEFNILTRVGQIDFFGLDFITPEHDSISLTELRKEIEEKLY